MSVQAISHPFFMEAPQANQNVFLVDSKTLRYPERQVHQGQGENSGSNSSSHQLTTSTTTTIATGREAPAMGHTENTATHTPTRLPATTRSSLWWCRRI